MNILIRGDVYNEVMTILSKLSVLEVGHLVKVGVDKDGQKVVSLIGTTPVVESPAKAENEPTQPVSSEKTRKLKESPTSPEKRAK